MTPIIDVRYVEHGKIFGSDGASDWRTLDYSDSGMRRMVGQFAGKILSFPQTTPFTETVGNVSICLLSLQQGYVFTQIQRRREGEKIQKPRTNRPFNHTRFTLLAEEEIRSRIQAQQGLYTGLVYDDSKSTPGSQVHSLKRYLEEGRELADSRELQAFDPISNDHEAVRTIAQKLINSIDPGSGKPRPVIIRPPSMDLKQKLDIVQKVQYWVYPFIGVITFALDYVTEQGVTLQLLDYIPQADYTPWQDRIYGLTDSETRSTSDYMSAVEKLDAFDLYHETLSFYLRNVSPDKAVALHELVEHGTVGGDKDRLCEGIKDHCKELVHLNPPHLTKVFDYLEPKDIEGLLGDTQCDENLARWLLQYCFEKKSNQQLEEFAPYYLARHPKQRSKQLRAWLQKSIGSSSKNSIKLFAKENPENQKVLYAEMLRARKPLEANDKVGFLPDPGDQSGGDLSVLSVLLQDPDRSLFSAIEQVLSEDGSLITEIEDFLRTATPAWKVGDYFSLASCVKTPTEKLFLLILRLLTDPKHQSKLKDHDDEFRGFLNKGRELCSPIKIEGVDWPKSLKEYAQKLKKCLDLITKCNSGGIDQETLNLLVRYGEADSDSGDLSLSHSQLQFFLQTHRNQEDPVLKEYATELLGNYLRGYDLANKLRRLPELDLDTVSRLSNFGADHQMEDHVCAILEEEYQILAREKKPVNIPQLWTRKLGGEGYPTERIRETQSIWGRLGGKVVITISTFVIVIAVGLLVQSIWSSVKVKEMRDELGDAGKSLTDMRSELVSASGGAGYWKDEASDSEVTREYYRLRQEDAGQPVDYDGNVTTTATAAATVTATATTTATHPPPSEMAMQTTTAVPTASETPTATTTTTATPQSSAMPNMTPTADETTARATVNQPCNFREFPTEISNNIEPGLYADDKVTVYDHENPKLGDDRWWFEVRREYPENKGWVVKECLEITTP